MNILNKESILSMKAWRRKLRDARKLRSIRKSMPDLPATDLEIIEQVLPFTMLSPDRLYAFMQACRHVNHAGIPGALVECGVWKGGAVMSALLTLRAEGQTSREVYLYDTFEGMPMPGDQDCHCDGAAIRESFESRRVGDEGSDWCRGEQDEVTRNVLGTEYPAERIHFVKGKVEETIPATTPPQIAVLRLDTDWYESTRHELEHLYPLLSPGGVLIIDDYGHWAGARKAVDEYFQEHSIPMLLHRTDYTGRVGIKAA